MSMIGCFVHAADEEIRSLLSSPEGILLFLTQREEAMDGRSLDIDKAWHGLHWLLTGTAWEGEPPLNFIVTGGAEIGDVDVGYGPAGAFTSDEVQSIDEALAPISTADLLARYDGRAMHDIYPDVWDRADEHDINLEYLASAYEALKQFVAQVRHQRLGIIAYFT